MIDLNMSLYEQLSTEFKVQGVHNVSITVFKMLFEFANRLSDEQIRFITPFGELIIPVQKEFCLSCHQEIKKEK